MPGIIAVRGPAYPETRPQSRTESHRRQIHSFLKHRPAVLLKNSRHLLGSLRLFLASHQGDHPSLITQHAY